MRINVIIPLIMTILTAYSCAAVDRPQENAPQSEEWIVDRFDDIKVLRYYVDAFDSLPLEQKELIYYLSQASISGRDIIFDQNFRYNLAVRRTLEAIYTGYSGDRTTQEWAAFEKYLKKVWFANGVHHHYSCDKFTPEFSRESFAAYLKGTDSALLPTDATLGDSLIDTVTEIIFDPDLFPTRINSKAGQDLLLTSAMNYYEGVTQKEADDFYTAMADPGDPRPISYGLNSKLTKDSDGNLAERTYKVGGMYTQAIERIVYWLEKAADVATGSQKEVLEALAAYYRSGDLKDFDAFNILWVQDTDCFVDFVNGFTEDYGDPLGRKGAWEGIVNFRDDVATERTRTISENAQWFEDNSPINPAYRKSEVKGVSAKVINAAMLAGDSYPATPIGINLPNADWIRREYGSKSVTIQNITYAYAQSAIGNGFNEEFVLRAEDRERIEKYGSLADDLHTDLHECLGHGSGQLAPGTTGGELKQYSSVLEETRADLFGLYYLADPKMVELGLIPNLDVAKAQYAEYIMNGLMTQLTRIQPGKDVEEAHMRNRKLIAEWCYEKGLEDNVIEKVVSNGKTYFVVNDFDRLRELFGMMLYEIQRIKSEGDFAAGEQLVEKYAVKVDPELHMEVLERYESLHLQPYSGFVNPVYTPVEKDGRIVDVTVSYGESYVDQMLRYSRDYSFLPTMN